MLIALAGPTAVGKSSLGLMLAEQLGGEIICADSRQIYAELDIGTAKPTVTEQARAPHHLFGIADPRETYTVAQFCAAAETAIGDIHARGRVPILVGGTGLYFRTLLYDYTIPEVAPQPELRDRLNAEEAAEPGCLHRRLQQSDPSAAARLHANDTRRIVRALEVEAVTGRPISHWQSRSQGLNRPCLYLALTSPQPVLWPRIQARIDAMFTEGLLAELEGLRQRYGKDLPLLQTLNYAETGDYLDGVCSLDEAKQAMFVHTRQYAKRQLTWFRRDAEIRWHSLGAAEDLDALARSVARQYLEHSQAGQSQKKQVNHR